MSLGALLDFWEGETNSALATIFGAIPPPYIWATVVCLSLLVTAGLTWMVYATIRRVVQIAALSRNYSQLRTIVQNQSEEILRLQESLRAYSATALPPAWTEQRDRLYGFVNDQIRQLRDELRLKSEKHLSDMTTLAGAMDRLQLSQSEFSAKVDALSDVLHCRNGDSRRANGHEDEWASFARNQLASLRAEMDFETESGDPSS